jgi:undecaprenol kinase/diacylglycerol kinase (ATP)
MGDVAMSDMRLNTQEMKTSPAKGPAIEPALRAATVWKSFHYAIAGIRYVFSTQRNAQIHTAVAAVIILMGLFLRVSAVQWAILVGLMGIVLSAEMFNTAVEAVVDLVCPEIHPLAKVAKDASAGAVLLLAVISVIVGLFVLGPPLWAFVMTVIL